MSHHAQLQFTFKITLASMVFLLKPVFKKIKAKKKAILSMILLPSFVVNLEKKTNVY
jgi:hypothetical protein